eukprot:3654901-Amphidinium_carterae.1
MAWVRGVCLERLYELRQRSRRQKQLHRDPQRTKTQPEKTRHVMWLYADLPLLTLYGRTSCCPMVMMSAEGLNAQACLTDDFLMLTTSSHKSHARYESAVGLTLLR